MSIQTVFMGKTAAQIKEHGLAGYSIVFENQHLIELHHLETGKIHLVKFIPVIKYKLIATVFPFIPYRQSFLVTRYQPNISMLYKPFVTEHLDVLRKLFALNAQRFVDSGGLLIPRKPAFLVFPVCFWCELILKYQFDALSAAQLHIKLEVKAMRSNGFLYSRLQSILVRSEHRVIRKQLLAGIRPWIPQRQQESIEVRF